jgi:hypothetical protein
LRNAFGENAPEFLLYHGFCFQTMQGYIRKNFVFSIIQRWWSICRTPALKFRLAPCEFWSFPTSNGRYIGRCLVSSAVRWFNALPQPYEKCQKTSLRSGPRPIPWALETQFIHFCLI